MQSTSERLLFGTRVRENNSPAVVCTEEPGYIEAFYNCKRLHSTFGYRMPDLDRPHHPYFRHTSGGGLEPNVWPLRGWWSTSLMRLG